MIAAFRVDASLQMGSGHVMRCLTLADALTGLGHDCVFISREHPGNLIQLIRDKGYRVYALPVEEPRQDARSAASDMAPAAPLLAHAWLGASQSQEARASVEILATLRPDWLIVDHYALDARWELAAQAYCRKLMVIDDLADREHVCDLLLDQTFGRDPTDYITLVPEACTLICGTQFALLRPEFAVHRAESLRRRQPPRVRHLLVTLGGMDKDNVTEQVLKGLRQRDLPNDSLITVIMGSTAPWLEQVTEVARAMPWPTRVLTGVSNMAQLMVEADLAIGAAGATSWERCCLGLPTIMLTMADNQQQVAAALEDAKAARAIPQASDFITPLRQHLTELVNRPTLLGAMSAAAAAMVDGQGTYAVASLMEYIQ